MTGTIKSDQLISFHLDTFQNSLAKKLESMVIAIRSPIYIGLDDIVRTEIELMVSNEKKCGDDKPKSTSSKKLPKLTVILETTGGSIEVVERINNVFRKHYKEVDYIVPGYAYSAGTVLVLAGDNIYMDYYSVLGPIDPQIQGDDGKFMPGMGYLYMYDELIEKSRSNEITNAELLFLTKKFDPARMFTIQQAKNHSVDLIKEWLPKHKFKNWKKSETKGIRVTPKMKKDRAEDIAEILGDAEKWHSHGRGITLNELRGEEIKLQIQDFGEDIELSKAIRQYYDLFIDYGRRIGAEYAIHTERGLRRIG